MTSLRDEGKEREKHDMVLALQGRTADYKVGPRGHTPQAMLWTLSSRLATSRHHSSIDRVVLIVVYVDPTGTVTPGGRCIFFSYRKNKNPGQVEADQAPGHARLEKLHCLMRQRLVFQRLYFQGPMVPKHVETCQHMSKHVNPVML